ncbi:MAG: AI-2E family transporter [Bacteroidales bacterium]|jgi:predicted PurR-regulated permease PerM|nr:AI-2E family transporter [Bacteroidales bacterium]
MEERSTDRLARIALRAAIFTVIALLCWYFRSVLVYIIAAFVVSLIGQPVIRALRKVRIKGHGAPDWLLAILTLLIIFALLLTVVTQIIPVVAGIIREAASGSQALPDGSILDKINDWLVATFPSLGPDFDGIALLTEKLKEMTSFSAVTGIIGSVASSLASFAVGAFATVFISFFFIKDDRLFSRIVAAVVPDRHEERVGATILEIEGLLSRYFIGLIVEIIGVMAVDFLLLWLVAGIGVSNALGIAFIAGLLNIVPYIGPLLGEVIGVVLCVILKYTTGVGLAVDIWWFALIVLGLMLGAQLVDNTIYQPLIYSTSIKAHPLEIFIVLLVAGHVGGAVGMLVAIPSYTVIRVIASRFFYNWKPVRRLIPNREKPDGEEDEETEMGRS